MAQFRFTGDYPAHVTLPDLSVRLVQPGEQVDWPAEVTPGPLWAAATVTEPPAAAAADEPADVKAWLEQHPQDAPAPQK